MHCFLKSGFFALTAIVAAPALAEMPSTFRGMEEYCASGPCVRPVARPNLISWARSNTPQQFEFQRNRGRQSVFWNNDLGSVQPGDGNGPATPASLFRRDRGQRDTLLGLVASCGSGQCQNAVRALINDLNRQELEGEVRDSQIGIIALAIFSATRDARTPEGEGRVADALMMLSENTASEGLRNTLRDVAAAIDAGDSALWELEDPFAASPS